MVDCALGDVAHENRSEPFGGELAALVNGDSRECRAEMLVVDDRRQEVIGIGIARAAALSRVMPAGRHMKEMIDHAGAHKRISGSVEIDSPRVACSGREYFEFLCPWMIPRHGCINGYARI